jgi:penicillin-binding protein 1C
VLSGLSAGVGLWQQTNAALRPVPASFAQITAHVARMLVTDRAGAPLNATYANDWNLNHSTPLHEMPRFLVQAFVMAEDQRFFSHGGQDWQARLRALAQNVLALETVSGASTITEQVVRMIHPRPRTLWSRWLEGWEAAALERAHGKNAILEFYLNQVPYAANRRGVAQAARHYFDRDLDTLSTREMLALAVLVRAPSRLDLRRGDLTAVEAGIERLAGRMMAAGLLEETVPGEFEPGGFMLSRPSLDVDARHFLAYLHTQGGSGTSRLRTTLDGELQGVLQALLDQRLEALTSSQVSNGALLVVDHLTGEVLAWVVGGAEDQDVPGRLINAVVTPRQPGSALKPFLYALALEKGWTAATLIDDAPLIEMVGSGLHSYSNYSRTFYGPLPLRDALGNSLNIPALRAIQFAGAQAYLELLNDLGFESQARHPDYYGDGLALGNGEVTLLELVSAYAALANRGVYRELALQVDQVGVLPARRVLSAEASSLIGNILSDPGARTLEFGSGSLLNLPVQTAVKTGTSSDYRDSWALGFNDRFVVGVWMGNLDQTPTRGITGSTGPALVLRGAFDLLNRHRQTRPLWLSPRLARHVICTDGSGTVTGEDPCRQRSEYFLPGTGPGSAWTAAAGGDDVQPASADRRIRLRQPTPGLHLAYDPRLPERAQAFEFVLQGVTATDVVEWYVDGELVDRHNGGRYLWPIRKGDHFVFARVLRDGMLLASFGDVDFRVK